MGKPELSKVERWCYMWISGVTCGRGESHDWMIEGFQGQGLGFRVVIPFSMRRREAKKPSGPFQKEQYGAFIVWCGSLIH